MAKNKIIYGNTTLIDLTDATLGQSDGDKILANESAYGKDGEKITGTCTYDADTSDANASASEILLGQTAYVNGQKVTGTMPNQGAVSGTIDDLETPYTIPAGCEPAKTQYILVQGTSQYKYMLTIRPDGTLNCSRYSAGTSAVAVPNNAWLNINATYISAS